MGLGKRSTTPLWRILVASNLKFVISFETSFVYPRAIYHMQRIFLRIIFLGVGVGALHGYSAQDINKETYTLFADSPLSKDSYTINFTNVSIIEYIRFVSKVGNLNFVFEEADLGFNVTIVSEDPISVKNIMSILVQILRVHDLALLEQDNNLLITKSKEVNQISTVVSSDLPMPAREVPLVTRVFRIKNASLGTVATIIKPLMSASAQVEVSNETRQLIVTDITTNVEKVDALLASIDAPHTPLDVESFLAKHVAPKDLITLAEKIVTPFAEGNPLIFVSQPETNTVFVVSTPYLIDRTMTLLQDLDSPLHATASPSLEDQSVLLYKVEKRSIDDLLNILDEMASQLQVPGSPSSRLYQTLASVKTLKDANVLIFLGDPETLVKVKGILSTVDSIPTGGGRGTFYVYRIHSASDGQIERSLEQMVENLQKSPYPDQELIQAIHSMRWIQAVSYTHLRAHET